MAAYLSPALLLVLQGHRRLMEALRSTICKVSNDGNLFDPTEAAIRLLVARAIRNAIRANRFARIIRNVNPSFYSANRPIRTNHSNFRFARIIRIARIVRVDSRESRH